MRGKAWANVQAFFSYYQLMLSGVIHITKSNSDGRQKACSTH